MSDSECLLAARKQAPAFLLPGKAASCVHTHGPRCPQCARGAGPGASLGPWPLRTARRPRTVSCSGGKTGSWHLRRRKSARAAESPVPPPRAPLPRPGPGVREVPGVLPPSAEPCASACPPPGRENVRFSRVPGGPYIAGCFFCVCDTLVTTP